MEAERGGPINHYVQPRDACLGARMHKGLSSGTAKGVCESSLVALFETTLDDVSLHYGICLVSKHSHAHMELQPFFLFADTHEGLEKR